MDLAVRNGSVEVSSISVKSKQGKDDTVINFNILQEVKEVKKRILGLAVALLFIAMFVAPVMAIGPTKAKNNKNLILQIGNKVWMKNPGGVFQEWNTYPSGVKIRLMRLDASKVNIGNAEDASSWTIIPNTPGPTFAMLLTAETNWVYFDYDTMYDLLRGFGMSHEMANAVRAPFNPLGCYYKADIVG